MKIINPSLTLFVLLGNACEWSNEQQHPAFSMEENTTSNYTCVPQVERCDGKDNDCDGVIDESNWSQRFPIASAADFNTIRYCPSGHFELTNNIVIKYYDLPGWTSPSFSGSLHGRGYTLTTERSDLFYSLTASGTIMYLKFNPTFGLANMRGGLVTTNYGTITEITFVPNSFFNAKQSPQSQTIRVGGLASVNEGTISFIRGSTRFFRYQNDMNPAGELGFVAGLNHGVIRSIYMTDDTAGHVSSVLGGVVGVNSHLGSIRSCQIQGRVGEYDSNTPIAVGAVAGNNYGRIEECSVSSEVRGGIVGGIVGVNNSNGVILDSYSANMMRPSGSLHFGGIAGDNYGQIFRTMSRSDYAWTVKSGHGWIVGSNVNQVHDSFYLNDGKPGCGLNTSHCGAAPKSMADLKNPSTYLAAAWSTNLWQLVQNVFPKFYWQ